MAPKVKRSSSMKKKKTKKQDKPPEYDINDIVEPTEPQEVDEQMVRKVMAPPDPSASNNIRVAIRVRPPNQRELDGGASNIIVKKTGLKVEVGEGADMQSFVYDVVLANATQEQAMDEIGVNLVHSAFHGFNSTCFAYGQTSSGKSYSMIGKLGGSTGISEHSGLTPRVATLLFDVARSAPKLHEFLVEASFLEIYNEKVRDLLEPSSSPDSLKIRESPQLGVHITGLTKKRVSSAAQVARVLITGFQNRTVSATTYNAESSRSHAIFEIVIQQKYVDPASGQQMAKSSKINMVDLAGSERSDKVGTTGASLVEGNNINKSLTVLGRCIKALVDNGKMPTPAPSDKKKKKGEKKDPGKVVPFRESILTWYLRESLAGNSRTTMLATVSPVALNREETLSTLRYAASAKNIKTAASKNEDPMEAKVRELAEEIQALKAALDEARNGAPPSAAGSGEGGGRAIVGDASYLDSLDDEGREAYLVELQAAMRTLMPGGFSKQPRRSTSMDDTLGSKPFPQLSCLNKDDMLSHAMSISIIDPEDGQPFTIGKQGGARENDFVLNGVGMQVRHCMIRLRNEAEKRQFNSIETCGAGAVVLVNGQALIEGVPRALDHLDRITIGPCRMIALWCERELSLDEENKWGYEQAFGELMHQESLQWTLLAPSRRRLLDKLKQAEILYVEQANAISIDMCTPIRFHATVLLGDGVRRLHKAHATVDDVLFDGESSFHDGQVVIVATVQWEDSGAKPIENRASDIAKTLDALNKSDDEDDVDPSTPRAPRHSQSFMMFENTLTAHTQDDDDDLMVGFTPRGEVSKGPAFFSAVVEDEEEEEEELARGSMSPLTVSTSGKRLSLVPSPRSMARHRKNNALFEMKMDMFEDLCSELKTMYGGVSSLCMGISELSDSFDDPSPDNMVVQIFETICDSDDGTITRSDLSAAFNLFDETSLDPSFAERSMHELLPQHLVSLDFKTFSDFLSKFLISLFYSKLEPFVSNQALFVSIGGRDLAAVIHEEKLKEHALQEFNTNLNNDLIKTKRELNAAKREMELLRTRLAQLVEQNLSNKLQEMNGEEEVQHRRVARNSATKLFRGTSTRHPVPKPRGSLTPTKARSPTRTGASNRIDRKSPPASPRDGPSPREGSSAHRGFARSVRRTSQSVDSVVGSSRKVASSSSSTSSSSVEISTSSSGDTTTETVSSSTSSGSGDGEEVKTESKKVTTSSSSSGSSGSGPATRPIPIRKGGMRKTASKRMDGNRTYSLNSLIDDDDNASDTSMNDGGDQNDESREDRNSFNSDFFRSAVRNSMGSESSGGDAGLDEMLVEQVMASEDPLGSFLTMIDLVQFKPALEKNGATMLVELLDMDIIGEAQLKKSGLSEDDIERFEKEREKMRSCLKMEEPVRRQIPNAQRADKRRQLNKHNLQKHDAPGGSGGDFAPRSTVDEEEVGSCSNMSYGSFIERDNDMDNDDDEWSQPEIPDILKMPVILLNQHSKRKMFAQAGKKPNMFETWAKGFGAGPELKTFKDNKWWLLPQGGVKGTESYVILNAHSNRKIYAKPLKMGAKWDKECGAVPSDDCGLETSWWLVKDHASGGYIIQNAMSKRKLFARMPHRGEQWAAGVGAAPAEHCGPETVWFIVPVSTHPNSEEEYDKIINEHVENQKKSGYGFKTERRFSTQESEYSLAMSFDSAVED